MTIPQWALDDYPGAERDFSDWLEQQFIAEYHSREIAMSIDGATGEIIDEELLARTRAMAKFQVLERTIKMRGMVERAQVWQLWQAQERGWFRLLPPEFDTIEELLAAMVETTDEGTGEYYDLTFLVKHVLPLLKKAGASPEQVAGLTTNMTKARAAVPYLREILRQNENNEEVIKQKFVEVADRIVSDVSVANFRQEMKAARGIEMNVVQPAEGTHFRLDRREILTIEIENPAQYRAIQIALRGLVNITDSDVVGLLNWTQDTVIGGNL